MSDTKVRIAEQLLNEVNWDKSSIPVNGNKIDFDNVSVRIKRKQNSFNIIELRNYLQQAHSSQAHFIEQHYKSILAKTYNMKSELDEDEREEIVGDGRLVDMFREYFKIVDPHHIYQTSEFPWSDNNFNMIYHQLKDENGWRKIPNEDLEAMANDYQSNMHLYEGIHTGIKNQKLGNSLMFRLLSDTEQNKIKLMERIKYTPQKIDYLRCFIEESIEDTTLWDAYTDIFRHWLWLVKRKALDKPTVYQILMVITGHAGTGKSYFITNLLNVFGEFVIQADLRMIKKEQSSALDSKRLIWLLDELSYTDKVSIEALKAWVTADVLSYRPLYSNRSVEVVKSSTGIGSSNSPLGESIMDETGNRRFIDFNIKQPIKEYIDVFKPEHKYYNEFQTGGDAWESMWLNVDESIIDGYIDVTDVDISRVLNLPYKSSTLYDFYDTILDTSVSDSKYITIKAELLYEVYKFMLTKDNKRPVNKNRFYKSFPTVLGFLDINIEITNTNNRKHFRLPPIKCDYFNELSNYKLFTDNTRSLLADESIYNKRVNDVSNKSQVNNFKNKINKRKGSKRSNIES